MERMESMLYEAALEGSVPKLLELLQQDRLILDKVVLNSLYDSPLHLAALLGHVDFVKEILLRKPELAGELDSLRISALHVASQKGNVDMVKALLQVNPDMCFARDVDGRNPLHLAAMKGRIDVLEELFRTRQVAASATTIWGETILHMCVKYNQLEALKFLLEKMDDPELLNAKDDYGMTILHLAVADKQMEAIRFLTSRTTLKVNALSANGFTALDILAQSKRAMKDWEIGELLRRAGATTRVKDTQLSANEIRITETNGSVSDDKNNRQQGKGLGNARDKEDEWLERKRNTLMVVASLIATMAFQACVNPPCGSNYLECFDYEFIAYNTTGFLASLSIVLLLISGLPLRHRLFMWILMGIMWVAITAMAFTYGTYIQFGVPSSIVIVVWIGVAAFLFLGHSTRLSVKMIKYFRKLIRRQRQHQAPDVREAPIASTV